MIGLIFFLIFLKCHFLRLVIWYSGDLKGGVVQFLAKNIFKFSLDQFENTRYALESGRFWFLRYHGRCKVMSHFFWLYASLNIRPLHCTQEAEYKVSLSYIFQDVFALTWITLFSKVAPLSGCIITSHYFRFILPSFLHIFTVHKIPIILSLLFCFRDVSSLTWRTCSLRVLPFSVSMITLHYFRFK